MGRVISGYSILPQSSIKESFKQTEESKVSLTETNSIVDSTSRDLENSIQDQINEKETQNRFARELGSKERQLKQPI